MEFNIDNYPGKVVMHCPEKWMAEEFCNYLHSIGGSWRSGISYNTRTNYSAHGKETCYWFNNGEFGNLTFFKRHGYEVLEFEEFAENFPFGIKDEITVSEDDAERFDIFFNGFKSEQR